jgi:dTDP-4-amino-4,6-dideoxygalactose transaminase
VNAFDIVKDFEKAICEYTGAPFCVAVNSCTNALFLCMKLYSNFKNTSVILPKRTYVSVPMQAKHAGLKVEFEDLEWKGMYQIKPFPIYDAARRFTSKMYVQPMYDNGGPNKFLFMCVSFHWSKILGIQQGGAILHNSRIDDAWFRRMRFDGRTEGVAPKDDNIRELGYHCYMSPEIAAEGLVRLMHLPKNNPDLPNNDYPDLSQMECFK